MRFLIDSHTLLWYLSDEPMLGAKAREIIDDPDNDVFVSIASIWELAIKRAKGKLRIPNDLAATCEKDGFTLLSIAPFHAEQAAMLPMHHRDPFDRMLIAQAQAEGLVLVTRDAHIRRYGIRTMAPDQ
ncbi:MAG: type II toxin-antitoxin system VapC family toxin [Chloroflexota bacterium]|nr:type II toxin-antitoxin system VapC family toxin [Chloroflexota bacterium]MDE2884401.1 type II toxin-antitoxin system VapC family toxin [Chloroflexota bacterium]